MALGITFSAGQFLTASDLQAMVTQIDSLTSPGWTSYTPTWSASGTAPAIGNGTLTGRYRRVANGDLVIVEIHQTWGSTTTNGTGFYSWSLPVTATSSAVGTYGSGHVLNTGDIDLPISSSIASTTSIIGLSGPFPNSSTTINSRGGQVAATSPFTMATGDKVELTCVYDV
jgi:hypothetical protein